VDIAPWLKGRAHVVRQTIPVSFSTVEDRLLRKRQYREELSLPQDAFIVGNGGWLIQRKRFDIFLRVAALVKKKLPNAYFVICGDGELAGELKNLAVQLGIGDCVRFEGWVSDLTKYYYAWDAMLFNTDFDANPRTPLEAVACGLPVVASSEYGGLSEFFSEPECGVFFATHDLEGLANGLLELAQDPLVYSAFQANSLNNLRQVYSESNAISQFNEILFG
jgi:glycosyltransferase involved in cell wall biosynthesis